MNKKSLSLFASITFLLLLLSSRDASAQSWSQCRDGRQIARCETYDCPKGDTNNDGKCTLTDSGARLTDSRNDSFCANPISGCGQVQYYAAGSSEACTIRAEENSQMECNLYALSNATFTPQSSATPRASATATPKSTATALPVSKGGDSELPKTGPEHIWLGAAVLLLGFGGVFIYEKYKTV